MPELRTETIDGETWTEAPVRVHCRECNRETHPAAETMPEFGTPGTARCWTCGDDYHCDEHGGEQLLFRDGNVTGCTYAQATPG